MMLALGGETEGGGVHKMALPVVGEALASTQLMMMSIEVG